MPTKQEAWENLVKVFKEWLEFEPDYEKTFDWLEDEIPDERKYAR
jgi:hypothetical protein